MFRIESNIGYGWEEVGYAPDFDTIEEAEAFIGDGSNFDGAVRITETEEVE